MKVKICLFVFLLAKIYTVQAQKAFIINDFIKGYTLNFISDSTNSRVKEYYKLTVNESKKTVLEYGAKELSSSQVSKTAKTIAFKNIPVKNIRVLGDVNFDGRPDIIIFDTEIQDEGCYNPIATANIFINLPSSFVYSRDISNIYNNVHCLRGGSFMIDPTYKRIITSSSGGAAIHGIEHYSVTGKEAKMLSDFLQDGFVNSPFSQITGKRWENNKYVSFSSLSLYEPILGKNKLLAFDTKNGKGRVILFKKDNILYYAFQQNDEYQFVSFAYPSSPEKADKAIFKFRKQDSGYELEFNSGTIKYLLYETPDGIGIKINVNGKIADWQGLAKQGTLARLANTEYKNLLKE